MSFEVLPFPEPKTKILMPDVSYDSASSPLGTEQAWGRPTISILPDGNIFVAVWILVKTAKTPADYSDWTTQSKCMILDPDLNIIAETNIKPLGHESATGNGGTRPYAYRLFDHTVWLFFTGEFNSSAMLDCSNGSITVLNEFFYGSNLAGAWNSWWGNFYRGTDSGPYFLHFPEYRLVVLISRNLFVFRDGEFLYELVGSAFVGYQQQCGLYRNPADPTKFGWFINASIGGDMDGFAVEEFQIDPLSGVITALGVRDYVNEDNGGGRSEGGWYIWQQGSTSPYSSSPIAISVIDENWNPNPGYSGEALEFWNPLTLERLGFVDPNPAWGSTYNYNEIPNKSVGKNGVANVQLVYNDIVDNNINDVIYGDTLVIRAVYASSVAGVTKVFQGVFVFPDTPEWRTVTGGREWDTFNEGNSALDSFDGKLVFSFTLLDDDAPHEVVDGASVVWSTWGIYVWDIGEPEPLRVLNDDGPPMRVFSGTTAEGARSVVFTPDGLHHEWSTPDDVEDYTKKRFPLRLLMPDGTTEVVAMLTPDTDATDSTA